jgi:NAD(P)H-hydrate epimerase
MKLVTAKQMQAIDSEAIEGIGIPGLELMEKAGEGTAEYAKALLGGHVRAKRVMIFCGKGNNGGDGSVIGRYLHTWGASVELYLFGTTGDIKGDALTNYKQVAELNLPVVELLSEESIPDMAGKDMLIDAIFGTGIEGDIRGIIASCIERMNSSGVPILAVDAPSGLNCDTGEISSPCVNAAATATMALPKIGQFLYPGRGHVGKLIIVDIGVPQDLIEQADVSTFLIDEEYVRATLPRRELTAHKGACGKLFILAGSRGYTGAACMAAESSIRSGVGLCFLGIPSSLNEICEIKLTEVMTRPLPELKKRKCLALRGKGEIRKHLRTATASIIGPGLGLHHETKELIRRIVSEIELPTLIDADGLNAFEGAADDFSNCKAPLVITPHPGELSRLLSIDTDDIVSDRMSFARTAADRFKCVVLLKGAPTFVSEPSGRVYVNPTGNAGMATGGTGDVLSGIIGALLAQGLAPLEAACCGAYIHGLAADIAEEVTGQMAMIPTDIISQLPEALKNLGF